MEKLEQYKYHIEKDIIIEPKDRIVEAINLLVTDSEAKDVWIAKLEEAVRYLAMWEDYGKEPNIITQINKILTTLGEE